MDAGKRQRRESTVLSPVAFKFCLDMVQYDAEYLASGSIFLLAKKSRVDKEEFFRWWFLVAFISLSVW